MTGRPVARGVGPRHGPAAAATTAPPAPPRRLHPTSCTCNDHETLTSSPAPTWTAQRNVTCPSSSAVITTGSSVATTMRVACCRHSTLPPCQHGPGGRWLRVAVLDRVDRCQIGGQGQGDVRRDRAGSVGDQAEPLVDPARPHPASRSRRTVGSGPSSPRPRTNDTNSASAGVADGRGRPARAPGRPPAPRHGTAPGCRRAARPGRRAGGSGRRARTAARWARPGRATRSCRYGCCPLAHSGPPSIALRPSSRPLTFRRSDI